MKKVNDRQKKRKQSQKKKVYLYLLSFLVIVGVGLACWWIMFSEKDPANAHSRIDFQGKTEEDVIALMDHEKIYPGIYINDEDVSGLTKDQIYEKFQNLSGDGPDFTYNLIIGGESIVLDTEGFTRSTNLEDVVEEAYALGRDVEIGELEPAIDEETRNSLLWSKRYEVYNSLAKNPKYLTINTSYDQTSLEEYLKETLTDMQQEAVDASIVGFDLERNVFQYSSDQKGFAIDVDDAVDSLRKLLEEDLYSGDIKVKADVTEPSLTMAQLDEMVGYINKSSSKTDGNANRDTNIRLVCEKIDGMMLLPGEYFDFNEYVGQRTYERGFKDAGAIYDGKDIVEVGGGICQVNSMMYHCALKAELEINLRRPHTYPSYYLDYKGIDATVTWGGANLKFTNTTDLPIVFRARLDGRYVIVEVYGKLIEDGMRIEVVGKVHDAQYLGKKYVADPEMAIGKTKQEDGTGRQKIIASCWQVYYKGDEFVKEVKAADSNYSGNDAIIHVGIKAPDGRLGTMDPLTGVVTPPEALPTEPPETTPPETAPPTPTPDVDPTPIPTPDTTDSTTATTDDPNTEST